MITHTVKIPASGVPIYGTSVNQRVQIARRWLSTAAGETLSGVIRSNSGKSSKGERSTQTVTIEVQDADTLAAP